MPKAEIGWTRRDELGTKLDVYAQRVGGDWRFFRRRQRYDQWQQVEQPPLEDWLELLDAVRRRVTRRLLRPEEIARVERKIRERFPDTPLDGKTGSTT